MKPTDFTDKIKDRWETTKRKMSFHVINDIEDKLKSYAENDITELWKYFIENYEQQSPPTYAHVAKAIEKLQLVKVRGFSQARIFVYECDNCKTIYANRMFNMAAQYCPSCFGDYKTIKEYDNQNDDVVYIQYQCIRARFGTDYTKPKVCVNLNIKGAYGATCKTWGMILDRYPVECQGCKCKSCCDKERKELKKANDDFANKGTDPSVLAGKLVTKKQMKPLDDKPALKLKPYKKDDEMIF